MKRQNVFLRLKKYVVEIWKLTDESRIEVDKND